MSARTNIGLISGVLVILLISASISIISNQSIQKSAEDTNQLAENVDKKVNKIQDDQHEFYKTWTDRQKSENEFNNQSEHQLVSLQKNASTILKQQLQNEEEIKGIAGEIRSNLTNHRIIANLTYDKIFDLENQTATRLNQTNQLIKFLTDNFGAQSGYLENENFQYNQANKTFENTNKTLDILNNQTR